MVEWRFPDRDQDSLGRIARLPLDTGQTPRDQHVVSRAILKGFAAPGGSRRGWQLRPLDVRRNRIHRDLGPKGCAVVRDFIVYAAGSAEMVWKRTEDVLPRALESARRGDLHSVSDQRVRDTITDAIALHFVRKPWLLREHGRLVEEATSEVLTRTLLERHDVLVRKFVARYKLEPAGPEALASVMDEAISPWRDAIESGALARVALESLFEQVSAGLREMPIEVWHAPPGKEFAISDNAAFTFAYWDEGCKIRTNMAIGDAHGIALPLASDCLVAIGREPKDGVMPADLVDLFNELQVRNADTYVYFRPGSGLEHFLQGVAENVRGEREQ